MKSSKYFSNTSLNKILLYPSSTLKSNFKFSPLALYFKHSEKTLFNSLVLQSLIFSLSKPGSTVTADILLPSFIYVILRATAPNKLEMK